MDTFERAATAQTVSALQTVRCFQSSSFCQIHERLFLALFNRRQAALMSQHILKVKFLVVPAETEMFADDIDLESFTTRSLAEVLAFNDRVNRLVRKNMDLKLVFEGTTSRLVQRGIAFLLGCHMAISHGLTADQVSARFDEHLSLRENLHPDLVKAWSAIAHASTVGWLVPPLSFHHEIGNKLTINLDEYLHYAR
jgi:hypothetical protein